MRASAALSNVQVTGTNLNITYIVLAVALAALGIAYALRQQVLAANDGTEKMREIAEAVQEGAAAYLARQFRTLSYFVGIVFFLLFALPADTTAIRVGRSIFFLVGAGFSALVGYNGMWLAVRANVRVAEAARQKDGTKAVQIAFRTGGVVGMTTVGLGLVGAALVVILFRENAPVVLEGFGFGAAMLAMFMRVGGGIFTKAADVGADLVGKVEKGIPEDDPRNAATIADNVGDNVGDCAGMAADLFESYAVTLVAALILGKAAFGNEGLIYPLIVPAIGIVTAVIGIFATRLRSTDKSAMTAINRSFFMSAIISAGLTGLATFTYLPGKFNLLTNFSPTVLEEAGNINPRVLAFGAVIIGIVLAAAIQVLTGFFTETGKRPVNDVAASSQTGAATVILAGISVGFESAVYSAILIASAVFGAFLLGGGSVVLSLFAIALAGTGLLTTVGVIVAMDTFGPISDNAQGIAEMSGDVKGEGAQILTSLDAVGNTTKAITKGIAIATAVLAATALFGAFTDAIKEAVIKAVGVQDDAWTLANKEFGGILDIADPRNLVGLIIGAAVVFLFSGLAVNAVSRAASAVVVEVRNQFKMHPGIMNGTEKPEYGRVVDICTRDSLRELVTPGLLAVMAPIAVGFGLGVGALGAYLAGAIGTGTLMAVFLSNSGGAWDNAKKMVEDGHYGGKGTEAHAATVVGDTVGDPFKDTAGPAINPLIKVMNLVGLLITPAIVSFALPARSSMSLVIALVATAIIIGALIRNRRQSTTIEY
ncbi:sodium-translocating pyrophosphatase [Candidatus Planktophila versatilis]|jgi:K(+)-stimulated pyrophosphate-energized sodium pump|uniref:sodium-translocating pyrophosphatase n=1 Tax=Candidatus Planktophila versatilis TaxID=1884905 RepID=UPI000BAC670C|nr:sodium-translocating pyrophosphatase [Candidatus Planktophila versatilis]ASY25854.1 K(+)-stimulated pyrophosphate-energized sodium pump [Candidatus Planktophila versatilis]